MKYRQVKMEREIGKRGRKREREKWKRELDVKCR
jgi:hypothetical protein